MTIDEANKIDEQAYNEMNRQKSEAQLKLNAYFAGYEKGLDAANKILRSHIYNTKEEVQK